jgi:hypothetical protein
MESVCAAMHKIEFSCVIKLKLEQKPQGINSHKSLSQLAWHTLWQDAQPLFSSNGHKCNDAMHAGNDAPQNCATMSVGGRVGIDAGVVGVGGTLGR